MNLDKRNYVFQLSKSYRELKSLFKTFSEIWIKKIPEYKEDYEVSILDSSDTSIKMIVFDEPVEISFRMALLKDEDRFIPYGKMILEYSRTEKDKEQITKLYFDPYGEFYKKIDDKLEYIREINIKQDNTYERILIEFLHDYLEFIKQRNLPE